MTSKVSLANNNNNINGCKSNQATTTKITVCLYHELLLRFMQRVTLAAVAGKRKNGNGNAMTKLKAVNGKVVTRVM